MVWDRESRFSLSVNDSSIQVPTTALRVDGKNRKLVTKIFSTTEAFVVTKEYFLFLSFFLTLPLSASCSTTLFQGISAMEIWHHWVNLPIQWVDFCAWFRIWVSGSTTEKAQIGFICTVKLSLPKTMKMRR